MKKIFFIVPTIGFGGAEKVYIDLANFLSENTEHEIKLIYITSKKHERDLPNTLDRHCIGVSSVRKSFFKLKKIISKEKPDVIYSNISHLNIFLSALRMFFKHKFKLIVRHTEILTNNQSTFFKRVIFKNMLQYFYRRADKVIFQSQYMSDDFLKIIKLNNSVIINNPVNTSIINSLASESAQLKSEGEINIGYVGRLEKVKNVEYIIRKFIYSNNTNNCKLHIIGNGSLAKDLRELVVQHNMENKIFFYGQQSNPYKYIKKLNLILNSSHSEGFPNTILESLALGVPVIAKKQIGGTKEIFDTLGIESYFVDEIDLRDIQDEIDNFPNNISKKIKEEYGIEKIALKYLGISDE